MTDVLVVGSVNIDATLALPRDPRPGETLRASSLTWGPGGKGANQAVAMARLGVRTAFVGMTGDDAPGRDAARALAGEGIDISGLGTASDTRTGMAVILEVHGESTIAIYGGANDRLFEDVVAALPDSAFKVPLVALGMEVPKASVRLAMKRARGLGSRVLFDPAPVEGVDGDLVGLADIILPNRHEASRLSGVQVKDIESARTAGQRLLAMGAGAAIVKCDREGAVVVTPEGSWHILPVPTREVDATAAEDAFLGGVAAGLARGLELRTAARLGAAAGAYAAGHRGALASLPRLADIGGEAFVDSIANTR